jgi:phage baseplate assembly protein W
MVPMRDTRNDINQNITVEESPTKTYKMKLFGDRINGKTDEQEAMKQAIYKILNTERYSYPIYSWNYGIELKDLFGKPKSFCKSEIKRRVKEALLQDERILEVSAFSFEDKKRRELAVTFTAKTIYVEINITKGVQI